MVSEPADAFAGAADVHQKCMNGTPALDGLFPGLAAAPPRIASRNPRQDAGLAIECPQQLRPCGRVHSNVCLLGCRHPISHGLLAFYLGRFPRLEEIGKERVE